MGQMPFLSCNQRVTTKRVTSAELTHNTDPNRWPVLILSLSTAGLPKEGEMALLWQLSNASSTKTVVDPASVRKFTVP